ncbi:hypothetical protein D9X30_3340 [Cupriavidus sp. U2]|uniref:DUF4142 domain-containing protein n=1 Tax=Cupriavidus sp. U2 TaxID=2920269 RepID=UPI00129EF80B|nr:DUF4142 domain-containing protein [Cupriavidus sp. U2]KAI3591515.1 hypothetical protein D9X30_3340 [Cupriavidus sp. U2]
MQSHFWRPLVAIASVLVWSSAAVAQGSSLSPASGTTGNVTPDSTKGTTAGGSAGASRPAHSDSKFIEDAAHSGHAEIEASKLAQQKSQNADVKSFADRMIHDHGKVGAELDALAAKKGVTTPKEPSTTQKSEIKALSALSGAKFDKMYASRIGVAAHESAVKTFREASNTAKDADVKAFAAKHLPDLEGHLQMARDLKKKVGDD